MATEKGLIDLLWMFDTWLAMPTNADEEAARAWYGGSREASDRFLAYLAGYRAGRNSAREEQMEEDV
jgi:hypothetical protein